MCFIKRRILCKYFFCDYSLYVPHSITDIDNMTHTSLSSPHMHISMQCHFGLKHFFPVLLISPNSISQADFQLSKRNMSEPVAFGSGLYMQVEGETGIVTVAAC